MSRIRAKDLLLEHAAEALGELEPRDETEPEPRPHVVDDAVYAGREAREARSVRPRREEPYQSVRHAIRSMVSFAVDGAPIASSGDVTRALMADPAPKSTPSPSVGHLLAESVHVTRVAFARAFDTLPPSCSFTRRECEFVFLRWGHLGHGPGDIARHMTDDGRHTTSREVRSAILHGCMRVYEYLRTAGMVPEDRTMGESEMPETRLSGWKSIAQHFGVSVRTVQRWALGDDPLPVKWFRSKVVATTSELEEWFERNTRRNDPRA